jgi:SAM-dependent methyltransferase
MMRETLTRIFHEGFSVLKLSDGDDVYRTGMVRWLHDDLYQLELLTAQRALHENLERDEVFNKIGDLLDSHFRQLNVTTGSHQYQLRKSKKGKWLEHIKAHGGVVIKPQAHNRVKNYLLHGHLSQPLIDLGIISQDGKIIDKMQDKYRQINRFLEIVEDALKKYDKQQLRIIDFGCGKSYLTFVLYDYLVNIRHYEVDIIGLDLKAEVIEFCNQLATKYHYERLSFLCQDIKDYDNKQAVDMVISLHACDTATDYALYAAVRWQAPIILSVPCCQHELNNQFFNDSYPLFTQYGLIKERISALVTDALRGELLEMVGYQVQMVEFVDLVHSPKNIMIRAVYSGKKKGGDQLLSFQRDFNAELTLYRLLQGDGYVK